MLQFNDIIVLHYLQLRINSRIAYEKVQKQEDGPGETTLETRKAEIIELLKIKSTILGENFVANDEFISMLATLMREAGCTVL